MTPLETSTTAQLAAVAASIVLVWLAVSTYNALVFVRNNVRKSWANVDVLLKQRHDEVPNLVRVCEAYARFERGTLEALVRARGVVEATSARAERGAAEEKLGVAMRTVLAVAEAYPDLKASDRFRQLQARITALEDAIADRREFFNDSVNTYNVRIEQIPYNLLARVLGWRPEQPFAVAAAEAIAPRVHADRPG